MKKRFLLCLISLMLLFTVLFTVSACKCSFSYKVSVTYDKTQGIIEGEGKYKKGTKCAKIVPFCFILVICIKSLQEIF